MKNIFSIEVLYKYKPLFILPKIKELPQKANIFSLNIYFRNVSQDIILKVKPTKKNRKKILFSNNQTYCKI